LSPEKVQFIKSNGYKIHWQGKIDFFLRLLIAIVIPAESAGSKKILIP
jgi:hypothetical protein